MDRYWQDEVVHAFETTRLGAVRMCDREPLESLRAIPVMDLKTGKWKFTMSVSLNEICIDCRLACQENSRPIPVQRVLSAMPAGETPTSPARSCQ